MFCAIAIDKLVPDNHPHQPFMKPIDYELAHLGPRFNAAYSNIGRPSIPPEHVIKTTLLQALFSISSETKLGERITYIMRFRWFLDLKPDDRVWDQSIFTKNRDRLHQYGRYRSMAVEVG